MATRDDATLVRAVLAGDRAAFGLLYDRYAPLVRAICHDTVRSIAEAQDLAQDVFLRAFTNLASLREPGQFAYWLIGIARLRCREWRREVARHRRCRVDLTAIDSAAPDVPPGDELEQVRLAIASLPEKERLAVHVFYLQEQPVKVAQTAMNLSRAGFYRVLERARKRLQRLLQCKQEGIR